VVWRRGAPRRQHSRRLAWRRITWPLGRVFTSMPTCDWRLASRSVAATSNRTVRQRGGGDSFRAFSHSDVCTDVVFVPALPGRAASSARVECVVLTEMRAGVASLCTIGDSALRVTPYHPVHVGGQWRFPCDLARVDSQPCAAVVSFLLRDCAPALIVDDVPVAALAHGLADNDVIAHSFFGTHRVVDSLRRLRGFADGCVVLHSDNALVRDPATGLVVALQQRRM
jgi:hypothetical protein